MLIGVAVLAVWIGWEANAIRNRRAAIAAFEARGIHWGHFIAGKNGGGLPGGLPRTIREALGDQYVDTICLPLDATDDREIVARLFPEAEVTDSP